jgi:hypothetical protein
VTRPPRAWHAAAIAVALVAGTCLVYEPARHYDLRQGRLFLPVDQTF